MTRTIYSVTLRNAEVARVVRNMAAQNVTMTHTFTIASTADLGQGIIGTLSATIAGTTTPAELMPVGTNPDISPQTVSN